MRFRSFAFLLLVIVAIPRPASAWGFDVHKYIMARAITLLPAELRPFFQRYQTTIVEHAVDPDLWRTAGWEAEPPRHFLDMDAYGPFPFRNLPRDYDEAVKRYGAEFVVKNGLLPWRTAEIYDELVEAFTLKAGYSRENVKFFSSVLTHYISDAHVPFHAVVNYDGQLTGQSGIHSRFESELFERYGPELKIAPAPVSPRSGPVRDLVFETLLTSFPLAQPLLEADKSAAAGREVYDDQYFRQFFSKARPTLERRIAESITSAASLISAAWIEAGRQPLAVEQPRVPRKIRR